MPNLNTGADAVLGDRVDWEIYNKFKNHLRGAGAPAGVVAGELMSRTTSDKLMHQGTAVEEEVLQATRSSDVSPKFSGLSLKTITKAVADSPYAAAATDYTILCNAVGGAMVVSLPAATGTGRILNIKKIDASAFAVTLTPNGAEKIDGAASYIITTQWLNITIQDGGAGTWYII